MIAALPDWLVYGPAPWLAATVLGAAVILWRYERRLTAELLRQQREQVYGRIYDFASERVRRRSR